MDEKTLTLLKASIKAWEKKLALPFYKLDFGPDNCPLCMEFNKGEPYGSHPFECKGCPVAERTGKNFCEETPYINVQRRRNDICNKGLRQTSIQEFALFHDAIEAEIYFLRSLLPTDEQ